MPFRIRTALAVVVIALLGAVPGYADVGNAVRTVSLGQTTRAPLPITLQLGRLTLIQLEPHVITLASVSDPDVLHVVLHGTSAVLIPLRAGKTSLALGLGGTVSAKFAVTVGTGPAIHALVVTDRDPVQGAAPAAQPGPGAGPAVDPPPTSSVTAFVADLAAPQRVAFMAYVATPTQDTLDRFVALLTLRQRATFFASATSPVPTSQPAATPPLMAGAATGAAQSVVAVSAPPGVQVTAVWTRTGTQGYLSYVVQNATGSVLRTDPHAIEVSGATGDITVRQMDIGDPGVVQPSGMETGVIAVRPTRGEVRFMWRVRSDADAVFPIAITAGVGP